MNDIKYSTLKEIQTQTEAWNQAIEVVARNKNEFLELWGNDYDQILFTGCGSSYYLALATASVMQSVSGITSRALPASELIISPATYIQGKSIKYLLFALSRSGTTTETVRAAEWFLESNLGNVIAVTNYPDTILSSVSDISLVIPK